MLVLGIDTATTRTTVALQGEFGVASRESTGNAGESAVLLIDQLFTESRALRGDLTSVVVGVGPGPYTSTRVGVVIARTISMALSIPAIGICTLDTIAAEVSRTGDHFGVATDARRKEVYYGVYGSEGTRLRGPAAAKPEFLEPLEEVSTWAGDGFDRFPDLVAARGIEVVQPRYPNARYMIEVALRAQQSGEVPLQANPQLGEHSSDGSGAIPIDATLLAPYPIYLRRPDAREPVQVAASA